MALAFLKNEDATFFDAEADALAQAIQDTIEDWIEDRMTTQKWLILADGTHVVDPQGWTIAKFYGDNAKENAQIAVTAVNSHDRLLAAAKAAIELADRNVNLDDDGTPLRTAECAESYERLVAAIAKAEEDPTCPTSAVFSDAIVKAKDGLT